MEKALAVFDAAGAFWRCRARGCTLMIHAGLADGCCGFTHILQKLYHIMISPDVNLMYTPNCRKDNKKHDNKRYDSGGHVL